MDAKEYWKLFVETGAPELYLMYTNALKLEGPHVPECSGPSSQSNGLQ